MSLVSTYCKCSDGKWYKEPIWFGSDWFICLDDDEPPELVIEKESSKPDILWFEIKGYPETSARLFPVGTGRKWSNFKNAKSWFGPLIATPSPPQRYNAVYDRKPDKMGVYYEFQD